MKCCALYTVVKHLSMKLYRAHIKYGVGQKDLRNLSVDSDSKEQFSERIYAIEEANKN